MDVGTSRRQNQNRNLIALKSLIVFKFFYTLRGGSVSFSNCWVRSVKQYPTSITDFYKILVFQNIFIFISLTVVQDIFRVQLFKASLA